MCCLHFLTQLSALSSKTVFVVCLFVFKHTFRNGCLLVASLWHLTCKTLRLLLSRVTLFEEEVLCKYSTFFLLGVRRDPSNPRQSERHYQALFTSHTNVSRLGLQRVDGMYSTVTLGSDKKKNQKKKNNVNQQENRPAAVFLTCDDANTVFVVSSDLLQFPFT